MIRNRWVKPAPLFLFLGFVQQTIGCGSEPALLSRQTVLPWLEPSGPRPDRCPTPFRFQPSRPTRRVELAGEWNQWIPAPMEAAGEAFERLELIPPGFYCYKLVVDGQWVLDPDNPVQAFCDGVQNTGVRVPDCAKPTLALAAAAHSDGRRFAARVTYAPGISGQPPAFLRARLVHGLQSTPLELPWQEGENALDIALEPTEPGKYTLVVEAFDRNGQPAKPLTLPFWIETERFDWRDALIYLIAVDRFVDGQPKNTPPDLPQAYPPGDWKGGDLAGITTMLRAGYFQELGVRALWLTPLNLGPAGVYPDRDGVHQMSGYHGYWPIEPRQIDPRLGTPDELHELVAEAHARGIRVLLDLVVNHVHAQHPYVKSHPEWFNQGCLCGTPGCDWTQERLTCLFMPYLPDINWKNKAASEQFLDDAMWWLATFDLDGGRIDAVKHVDDLAIFNLAARVHQELEQGGTELYLDGETAMGWAGDSVSANESEYGTINRFLGPDGLDGQFDFVLHHAVVRSVFLQQRRGFVHLDFWTRQSQLSYPPRAVMTPFIGSHDSARFISLADYRGQDGQHPTGWADHKWVEQGLPQAPRDEEPYLRARLAFCWLLTLPGAPLIYMGDEYGEYGGQDPDNRKMFRTPGNHSTREDALLQATRALGQARRRLLALRRGSYQTLLASETALVTLRKAASGEQAIVALNGGLSEGRFELGLQKLGLPDGAPADQLPFGGKLAVSAGRATLTLPPRSCAVFAPGQ